MVVSRAMVLEKFAHPLVKKTFRVGEIPDGHVLVKILASGVCGSDVHIYKGEDPRTPLPIILGHESVGEIVHVSGEKVDVNGEKVSKGDWITWNRGIVCKECYWCTVARQPHLCPNRKVYGINISSKNYPYLRGGYAEHMVLLPETEVLKISKSVDPAVIAFAGCSGATAANIFDSLNKPLYEETVVIQGAGPLGLYSVIFARATGARRIIVISGSPLRLKLAKEIGADVVLNRHTLNLSERRKRILDLTHGRGADVAIEATGSSAAVVEGLEVLRRGGTYLIAGVAVPQPSIQIKVYEHIVNKGIHIQGIWVSDTTHVIQAVSIAQRHQDTLQKMITHRMPLTKANEALDLMEKREALKVILFPD